MIPSLIVSSTFCELTFLRAVGYKVSTARYLLANSASLCTITLLLLVVTVYVIARVGVDLTILTAIYMLVDIPTGSAIEWLIVRRFLKFIHVLYANMLSAAILTLLYWIVYLTSLRLEAIIADIVMVTLSYVTSLVMTTIWILSSQHTNRQSS